MSVSKQVLTCLILLLVSNVRASLSRLNKNGMDNSDNLIRFFKDFQEHMEESMSALLGTNAQFKLQINELTRRMEGYETRETENLSEIRNLKSELEFFKSAFSRKAEEDSVDVAESDTGKNNDAVQKSNEAYTHHHDNRKKRGKLKLYFPFIINIV